LQPEAELIGPKHNRNVGKIRIKSRNTTIKTQVENVSLQNYVMFVEIVII